MRLYKAEAELEHAATRTTTKQLTFPKLIIATKFALLMNIIGH